MTATTLFSRTTAGTATGLGWNGAAKRIALLLDEASPRLETLSVSGALQFTNPLGLAAYGPVALERPKVAGLAVSGSRDIGVANGSFLGSYLNARSTLIDWSVLPNATASNHQRAVMFHDIECDPRTFDDALQTVVWGISRSGRVIRAVQSTQSVCGFGGDAPVLAYCRKPGATGQPEVSRAFAGGAQTFFSLADGSVLAAGDNSVGQLGIGDTSSVTRPVVVGALAGATRIASSRAHTLALTASGSVLATGDNAHGQLGIPTLTGTTSPLLVPGLGGVIDVGAGDGFSVALTSDGRVLTWGRNDRGQLGSDSTEPRTEPAEITLDAVIVQVVAGSAHVLARDAEGSVWAWGANDRGQLGSGILGADSLVPIRVVGPSRSEPLGDITHLAAGAAHSLAARHDGVALAWGDNTYGQLGVDGVSAAALPQVVHGVVAVHEVSAGSAFSGALSSSGQLWAWGDNGSGQLGDGSTESRAAPAPVRDGCDPSGRLGNVQSVAFGAAHAAAVGSAITWGDATWGQLGLGTTTSLALPGYVTLNAEPSCGAATASPSVVWPPSGGVHEIQIEGVLDPEGGAVSVQVLDVHQDEPQQAPGQGTKNPDAIIAPDGSVRVRAERAGSGDGRVYHIRFEATDTGGASCTGVVQVCVPHNASGACVDGGPLHSSTAPAGVAGCTMDDEDAQPCLTCLHRSCCGQVAACQADTACSTGERECMDACVEQVVSGGVTASTALSHCEPKCAAKGKKLSKPTRDLWQCANAAGPDGCAMECVGAP